MRLDPTKPQRTQYLFEYLDRIARGETVIIRRNEQDVARISPIAVQEQPKRQYDDAFFEDEAALLELQEELRKTAIVGDLLAPLDVEWNAMKD